MSESQDYALRIDGPLLRRQRRWLLRLAEAAQQGVADLPDRADLALLEGVIALLDEIADQAHDRYGIDCLLEESAEAEDPPHDDRCECELPGFYGSGVPGILAPMEDGHLASGAGVERCDRCQRYPSDEAARMKLRELGLILP